MRYEIEWHRVSKELPAPFANCYLAVQASPEDLELTVTMGYYDDAVDVFVNTDTNDDIPKENVWLWTMQLAPEIDEVER